MQSRVDRSYDRDTFNRDIGELYRTGLFEKIEPYTHETKRVLRCGWLVREKPTVQSVVFHGNRALDNRQLQKHCGLDIGDPTGPPARSMRREIGSSNITKIKVSNNADVQVVSGNTIGDRDIVFKISEGDLERIWEIRFVGNQDFSSALLQAKIKSRDARGGLTAYIMNKASPESITEDKERLLNYYRGLGYFDARIEHRIDYSDDGNGST